METKMINSFGKVVPITKDEFLNHWINHFDQLYYLSWHKDDWSKLDMMKNQIKLMASAAWDRMK